MAKKITFGNFKGGVGKTTASSICSFILQEKGYKVLFLDFDPQGDSTRILATTFGKSLTSFTSVYEAILEGDLKKAIMQLSPNFDLLPSGANLVSFTDHLNKVSKNKGPDAKHYYLDYLLKQIEDDYDYIIIDVPPTISEFTNNALVASDFALPILQTEISSFLQTVQFKKYVEGMKVHNPSLTILGVLPYLEKKGGKVDTYIVEQANAQLTGLLFKTHVYKRERIKRYALTGIKREDFHDKKALKMYEKVVDEIIKKVGNTND